MAKIHRWILQETSGTTVADSVGGNTGTLDGSVTLGAAGPIGNIPKAADFAGTSQTPIVLASLIQLSASQSWSITFWAKQNTGNLHGMILGDSSVPDSYFWLTDSVASGCRVRSRAGLRLDYTVSAATKTKWSHYTLMHDVSGVTPVLSLFIDGVFSESFDVVGGFGLDLRTFGSGYNSLSHLLKGSLADISVHDSILTQQEINDSFAGSSGSFLSITNLSEKQFFQRPSSGDLSLTVTGSCSADEVIEYQIDAGSWQVLATAAGGLFSSAVDVPSGNRNINVRLSSYTGVTDSKSIKVGDVFVWTGQSNAEGHLTNGQSYTESLGFRIFDEDGDWIDGASNYKSPGASEFGIVPRLASLIEASTGVPVAFICQTTDSTGLVSPADWSVGGLEYNNTIAAVTNSGINSVAGVLFFQGETDVYNGVSRSAYLSALQAMADGFQASMPGSPKTLVGQIDRADGAGTLDEVRNAQSDSWSQSSIAPGAVTYDIGPLADSLHFSTDAEATLFANRWWAAIEELAFGGTWGTPPSLASAVVAGAIVTLTYDRDLETATSYIASAWNFDDNGSAIVVTAATKTADRVMELTLASAPTTTSRTVTLGAGYSAQGSEVPRGLGGQPALPAAVSVTSVGATPGQSISVKNVRRAISVS